MKARREKTQKFLLFQVKAESIRPFTCVPISSFITSEYWRTAFSLFFVLSYLSLSLSLSSFHTCFPHASVGGIKHSFFKRIIARGSGPGEGGVDDSPVHVRADIEFHHVGILEDGFVARVGGVMRGDVVQGAPRGESNAYRNKQGKRNNGITPANKFH